MCFHKYLKGVLYNSRRFSLDTLHERHFPQHRSLPLPKIGCMQINNLQTQQHYFIWIYNGFLFKVAYMYLFI